MVDPEVTTQGAGSPAGQAATDSFDWESIGAEEDAAKAAAESAAQAKAADENARIEKEKIDSDPDHPTKLGRKVKDLADKFDSFLTEYQQERASRTSTTTQQGAPTSISNDLFDELNALVPCPVNPDEVLTAREQVQYNSWWNTATAAKQDKTHQSYSKAYLGKMKELAEEGGDLHARIVHMITSDGSPYNRVRKGMGDIDAELNYHMAHKALLSGKEKPDTTRNFVNQSTDGTGVTAPVTRDTTTSTPSKLDPMAEEYANYLGMSAEDRAAAMTRPLVIGGVK